MATRISNIVPFFLITLLCVGGVEGFYLAVEHFLLDAAITQERVMEQVPVERERISRSASKRVDYSVITKRNLFGPPPQEGKIVEEITPPPQEEIEPTQLEVVLMGTIGGGDENSRAIILNKKDRKQELYQVGDSVQGALIKQIERGKVILNLDDQDQMLDMSEASQYAPKYSRPVSVSPTVRRRRVAAPPSDSRTVETNNRSAKPRVVRPTRRIVRPRSSVESDQVELTGEDVPEELSEELSEELELPEEAERSEETVDQQ